LISPRWLRSLADSTWPPTAVLRLTFPEAESRGRQSIEPENQKRAVESLFEQLEAFLQQRASPDGLRRIFLGFERWLRRQDWYGPSSPQWIADEGAVAGPAAHNHVVRRKKN
jgi:hypothetical protein